MLSDLALAEATAAEVEWCASHASIEELLRALDERGPHIGWFCIDEELFACPRCQLEGHPAVSAPAVRVRDDVRAECASCQTTVTVFELRRLVLEDAEALARLLVEVGG